jgi:hypothetical protein
VKVIEYVRYKNKKISSCLRETNDVHVIKSVSEEDPEPGESSPVWNIKHSAHSQGGGCETSSPENLQEPVIPSVSECVSNDSDVHSPIDLELKKVDIKP